MKGKKKILLLLAASLFLGPAFRTYAQEDSLRVKVEPSIFNMKMQQRFTPSHQLFHELGRSPLLQVLENSSISLSGSYHRWLDPNLSSGPSLTLSLNKWINPTHGVRLEASAGYFFNNEEHYRVKMLPDIRISHLFNLSAYLDGYDYQRPGYLYTVAGAGYTWLLGNSGSWTAQLGLGYSFHILRGTDLFVEPVLELNGNGLLQLTDGNWRGYHGGIRGNVGINYRIDRWNTLIPPKVEHRWFLVADGGPAWMVYSPTASPKNGYHVSVGVGERLSNAASVRLSGAWTQTFLPADNSVQSRYAALRLEGMVDLLRLGGREELPWGFSLMAGPETGLMDKRFYVGATAGAQLGARVFKRFSAFVEPRISLIPYVIDNADASRYENTLDLLLSTNLGLQYNIPTVEERIAAWDRTKQWSRDTWDQTVAWDRQAWDDVNERWDRTQESMRRTGQRINLFAALEGSYFRPLGRDFANGPLASLSLGTWLNELNGVLVNTGLGYFQDLQYRNGYVKTMEFSAAYLLNLTRLAKGPDPDRQLNLSLLAGAGYMMPLKEKWTGSAIFRSGLDLRMHVLPRTDLIIRPEMDFLKAPSDLWSPAVRVSSGLSYSMGGAPVANFSDKGREWFVSVGAGIQNEILRLAGETYEDDPLGEYRLNAAVGRRYSARLDWRVTLSYLSQLHGLRSQSFTHRLRFTSLNVEALYNLLGDDLLDRKWSLSLVGGPEIGLQHKGNEGEDIKGSGLILKRKTVSAFIGLTGGLQVKYRFTDAISAFIEPKYSLAPYVARTSKGEENYYAHIYGTHFGLEYMFGRERFRGGFQDIPEHQELAYTFIQATATAFSPFGRGYANGPMASLGVGHWFSSPHGAMLEVGVGYFRDNQRTVGVDGHLYAPQHMAAGEVRGSYLVNLNRLASLTRENMPVEMSLISGIGYLIPEVKQANKGTFTVHGGFDVRMHILPGTDLVVQPQLEMFTDPHKVVDGTRDGLGGAFRGSFGLSYNLTREGRFPNWDPGKDWFVAVSSGIQNESGRMSEERGTETSRNEYRIAVSFGRRYTNAFSLRLGGSFSEIFPQESTFLHSLRYTSANLDFLYDLLANERDDKRISFSLLGGPEAGFFNKNYSGKNNEHPMTFPIRIGRRVNHGVGAYIGLSVGMQLKVRITNGISLYLEPRYSMVPYVIAPKRNHDHRNMTSNLWNANFGIQYSFARKQ